MIILLARASARYYGRIDAELALGDICLMIRSYEHGEDGSVLLHDMQAGIPPRNWMPAGSIMEKTSNGYRWTHSRGEGEVLEVFIDTIYSRSEHIGSLKTNLIKLGAEREFSDLLARKLDILGQDLELVKREWRSLAGPIDLLCVERQSLRPVCIEVKRRRVDINALWQTKRYLDAIASCHLYENAPRARGLLIGPVIAQKVRERLSEEEMIDAIRVSYTELYEWNSPSK
jgi:RecB family endonuclease NucS